MAEVADITIAKLGSQGDGVAERDGHALYVPFALPGERWRESEGAFARLTDAPGRQQASLPAFYALRRLRGAAYERRCLRWLEAGHRCRRVSSSGH